jgi:hypothetical protein
MKRLLLILLVCAAITSLQANEKSVLTSGLREAPIDQAVPNTPLTGLSACMSRETNKNSRFLFGWTKSQFKGAADSVPWTAVLDTVRIWLKAGTFWDNTMYGYQAIDIYQLLTYIWKDYATYNKYKDSVGATGDSSWGTAGADNADNACTFGPYNGSHCDRKATAEAIYEFGRDDDGYWQPVGKAAFYKLLHDSLPMLGYVAIVDANTDPRDSMVLGNGAWAASHGDDMSYIPTCAVVWHTASSGLPNGVRVSNAAVGSRANTTGATKRAGQ